MASMERDNPSLRQANGTQLLREIENLEKVLSARIASIESAISVAHDDLVRVPTQVDKAIEGLRDLTTGKFEQVNERFRTVDEKFTGVEIQSRERHEARDSEFHAFEKAIDTRFDERDARRNVEVTAAKEAVTAAFSAAKEAVGAAFSAAKESAAKTETSMTNQLAQISVLITTLTASIGDKIDGLSDRMTRGEASHVGRETGRSDVAGWIVGGLGILFGLVGTIAAVVLAMQAMHR